MNDNRIEAESAALVAPSAARNCGPILDVLRAWLPQPGLVLEVASGTGEHAAWFAADLPDVTWQPTDRDPARLPSIAAWRAAQGTPNLLAPALLDAAAAVWPVEQADAVLAINMAHIAPWSATLGLVAGAARVLRPGGVLLLYGPFRVGGAHTSPGNESFDADLRARDPDWGVRDSEAVVAAAEAHGMALAADIPMPANNRMIVFRRP
jgi:SAM-dependent methyltransferase